MAMQLFAGALLRIFNIRSGDPKTQMSDLGDGGRGTKAELHGFYRALAHWAQVFPMLLTMNKPW